MSLLAVNTSIQLPGTYAGIQNLDIGTLLGGAITLILIVAAVVFFFMLIIGGLRWIMSGGDKAQTEGARNQITAALVGLVIVFAAFAVAKIVESLFGISIFNIQLPTLAGPGSPGLPPPCTGPGPC